MSSNLQYMYYFWGMSKFYSTTDLTFGKRLTLADQPG